MLSLIADVNFSKVCLAFCVFRYLFQLLMEAGCLEWAMLVCVILRDAVLFLRVVNLACLADTPHDVVRRLQSGLALLEQWISTDW